MKLRITGILLLLFGAASLIYAQEKATPVVPIIQPCTVALKNSPTIRGLRLEMSKADVKKEYPSMVFTDDSPKEKFRDGDNVGLAKKAEIANSAHKDHLEEVNLFFGKDDRLLTILLVFETSIYGPSLKEFADKISDSLKLPKNAWEPARGGGNSLALYCDGFAVSVEFTAEKKPQLFLAKAWEKLTDEEKKALKP